MSDLRCGRCGTGADRVVQQGMTVDPAGWITVTVQAHPVRNIRLCPACSAEHHAFTLNTPTVRTSPVPETGGGPE